MKNYWLDMDKEERKRKLKWQQKKAEQEAKLEEKAKLKDVHVKLPEEGEDTVKTNLDEEQRVSMGFNDHPGFKADYVWPRAFRFLLTPKTRPELQYFFRNIEINYAWKSLELQIYDTTGGETHNWVQFLCENDAKKHEELKLVVLDGCGVPLYRYTFSGLVVVAHDLKFDYEKSDVATHTILLEFKDMRRMTIVHPKKAKDFDVPDLLRMKHPKKDFDVPDLLKMKQQ